jgi:hypothetical protein
MCQPHEPVFSSNYVHLRRVRGKDGYMIMPRVQLVICAMLVHITSIPVWIQSRRARRCICQEMRCTSRCVGVWFVKCCCCSSAVQLQQGSQKVSLREEAKTAKHVKRLWNKALVETGANLGNTAHATVHACARCWLIFPSVATVQKFAGPASVQRSNALIMCCLRCVHTKAMPLEQISMQIVSIDKSFYLSRASAP